ncbi:MAG: aminomethyl-transferring glycine dehydrogenase subunit GcvPB [Kiritimatiellia bacterium]|jgi:glycine dehydrogenase subunit 2|nr:aminomethyl-transferring glycine dehydrogenase subunit GcvPB [Kiritimatiellia bacterium]MDP6630731.1 aminomethyl-transferring glycine dehydrogenase subunit GcvPB [Kiritimatiellia bacterium]MDP6809406.1 aminomethyl-transferring glycine dehydrogenase subunit GcvPB [Kiritimatiellia bacterium]MDP7023917.1 aminomethyl-transferring glycine dehydrogenase subunit GcvPB [Kiritimatiellia bacterium]
MSVVFERSVPGRRGVRLPGCDVPLAEAIPEKCLRERSAELCELSELDVVRHFTGLSRLNFGVDTGFYPLGSCTMKYNPRVSERIAGLAGFSQLHPFLPQLRSGGMLTQGALQLLYELEHVLCEITGMEAFTLQPLAGAHGELTGMMLIAAYHRDKGNRRQTVLIPDEAHGTNPSSAAITGYRTVPVPTDTTSGRLDLEALEALIDDETAAIMLTNPNTLGIFNSDIERVVELAHARDALVYYDGANLNAILGKFRPGDAGIDVMHVNVHKTCATPHGGGGPGAGPVGVRKHLVPFLPISRIQKRQDNSYMLDYDQPKSIGYVAPFYGNFSILVRAYAYIKLLGGEGLVEVSENAVLNANYVMQALKERYALPYDRTCMHECVLSASRQAEKGVHAIDIAKALIDRGYHPPTVYFPLIVKEAMMIEPTETESKETLDAFISAMLEIADEAEQNPDAFAQLPKNAPVCRPDEVKAARDMDVCYDI